MSILRRLFGIDSSGVERAFRTDSAGRVKQSLAQPDPSLASLSAIGQALTIDMDGFSSFTFNLAGSFVGSVTFEQSLDGGTTWTSILASRQDGVTTASTLGSVVGVFTGQAPGAGKVRARCSAYTSGSIVVQGAASSAPGVPTIPTHPVTQSGTWSITMAAGTGSAYELAATTNATSITTTATNLDEVTAFNPTGVTAYLKFYNKASAPTVGTDVPVYTLPIPANSEITRSFGTFGKRFATGLAFACTTNAVKTDNTALANAGIQLSMTRH